MSSFEAAYLAPLTFSAAQLATIHRIGEARGRQDLFVVLEVLRQAAVVESSESSSR
jgi:hypothetical protein